MRHYKKKGKIMTWNDELNGHLEEISARLTHLESLSMLAFEHDDISLAQYPPPAVPSSSRAALRVSALAPALN
jgi:hypothetical protein